MGSTRMIFRIIMIIAIAAIIIGKTGKKSVFSGTPTPNNIWDGICEYWAVACWGLVVLGIKLLLPETFSGWWGDQPLFWGSQIPPVMLAIMWGKGEMDIGKWVLSLVAIIFAIIAFTKVAGKSGYEFFSFQTENPPKGAIFISANAGWVDTGVKASGEKICFSASGKVNSTNNKADGAYKWVGPNGWTYNPSFRRGRRGFVKAPLMSLVGKIGNYKFLVGENKCVKNRRGKIYLAANDDVMNKYGKNVIDWVYDNPGKFIVKIQKNEKMASAF